MLSVDMAYTVDSELSSGTSDLCLLLSPTKLNQLMKTIKLTKKNLPWLSQILYNLPSFHHPCCKQVCKSSQTNLLGL